MTTINSSLYANLNNATTTATATPQDVLLQALNNTPLQSDSTGLGDQVVLSDAAKQYLATMKGGSSASNASSTGFTPTAAQQAKITAILDKYKDAPYTQDTYNQIQDDLRAAGLSPDQMGLQQKIKNFNATQILIDLLSGRESQQPVQTDEKADGQSYMDKIVAQWKSVSTTAADTSA